MNVNISRVTFSNSDFLFNSFTENDCEDICAASSSMVSSCAVNSGGLIVLICDDPALFGGCNGDNKSIFDQYCRKTCENCQG